MKNADGTWLDSQDSQWYDSSASRWGGRVQDAAYSQQELNMPISSGDAHNIIEIAQKHGVLGWKVDKGAVDGVDLSGISLIMMAHILKNSHELIGPSFIQHLDNMITDPRRERLGYSAWCKREHDCFEILDCLAPPYLAQHTPFSSGILIL